MRKEILFEGYIYVDLDYPIAAWECYRGALLSPIQPKSSEVQFPSLRVAGIIRAADNINLANEFFFEKIRAAEFPSQVSRLQCLYAFQDKLSAEKARKWGNHFNINNLAEVGIGVNRITKVDVDWINKADRYQNGLIKMSYVDNIRKYWRGEPYSPDPHWECLIDGFAMIYGTDLRNRAYQVLKRSVPKSLGLLELARIAEVVGSNLGHVTPYVMRVSEEQFKLCYLVDMQDASNEEFLKRYQAYRGPVNHDDLKEVFDPGEFTTPDLKDFEYIFTLSKSNSYTYSGMKIHA